MRAAHASTVYRDMTQAELDAQYDQSSAVPNMDAYMRRWSEWSAQTRQARRPDTFDYGAGAQADLHVFAGQPDRPIHMHLHGGAWRALDKDDCSFVADGLGAGGASVAVVNFALAPSVSLATMVAQVRAAALWLLSNAKTLGAAPGRLAVSGHSSGAHLASCLLNRSWWQDTGLTAENFAGLVLVSGAYDLEPVRLSARNRYLSLSRDDATALSALHHLPGALPPIRLFWGDGELAEFQRQGRAFAAVLAKTGANLRAEALSGRNHFEMYDAFRDPASPICRAARALTSTDNREYRE